MISPSPAKRLITGRRTDIEFEQYKYLIRIGLWISVLAAALFIADRMRKKNGLGWIDFFSYSGKYAEQFFALVPKNTQGFNIVSAFMLVIGGLLIWIAIELLSPDEEIAKGPLDMAPPSAEDGSGGKSDTSKLTLEDVAPQ